MKDFLKILLISVICSLLCSLCIGTIVVNEVCEILTDEEIENPVITNPKEWYV